MPKGNRKGGSTIRDLERAIAICEGLKYLRENQSVQFASVALKVYLVTNEGVESVCDPYYGVSINGDADAITNALKALFESSAGIPDYVLSGYDIVDAVLAKYDKKTGKNKGLKFLLYGTVRKIVDK